jgi:hypothetical protein
MSDPKQYKPDLYPGIDYPFDGEPYYDYCPNCDRYRDFQERAWFGDKCSECHDKEPGYKHDPFEGPWCDGT